MQLLLGIPVLELHKTHVIKTMYIYFVQYSTNIQLTIFLFAKGVKLNIKQGDVHYELERFSICFSNAYYLRINLIDLIFVKHFYFSINFI